MAPSAQDQLAAGQAALTSADWRGAQAAFTAALSEQDGPELHDGLGIALRWLNAIEQAHQPCAFRPHPSSFILEPWRRCVTLITLRRLSC